MSYNEKEISSLLFLVLATPRFSPPSTALVYDVCMMWRLSARYTSAYPTFIERGRYIPSLSIHLTFCCVFLLFAVATYLTARQCFRNLIRNFAKLKCRLSNRHFQYFFSSSWSAAALVYRLPVSFIILLLSSSIHVSMFMFFCVRVCFISLICSLNCRTHTTKR